jgi:hypothetical protein
MRVKKVNYKNKESIIIYITLQEKLDENINKQIVDFRKTYKDVAVFISGRNSIEKTLSIIIQERG